VVYKFKSIKAQNCHDDSKKVRLYFFRLGKCRCKNIFLKYP
jgi:hypothetical protein